MEALGQEGFRDGLLKYYHTYESQSHVSLAELYTTFLTKTIDKITLKKCWITAIVSFCGIHLFAVCDFSFYLV